MTAESNGGVVLVTGASSGFGRETAALLAERGWRVYGTSRKPAACGETRFELLELDVASERSVADCVGELLEREGRVDALVNNAGVVMGGALEETSDDEALALLQVNLLGPARVARAVLPAMRSAGRGRIVNVGSLASMVGLPFQAWYSASKAGLALLSEGLRQEVRAQGVWVSLVEPGDFATEISDHRLSVDKRLDVYAAARERAVAVMAADERSGPGPVVVARMVARALSDRRPRHCYRVGREVPWLTAAMALLPARFTEAAVRRLYRVDG